MSFPEYAPDQLLPAMRDYLIEKGIVRRPSDPPSGNLHPMWLDPRRGVPYPGQVEDVGDNGMDPDLVLGAYPATGIPSRPFEGFLVTMGATIWYRGRTSPPIQTIHEQIRGVLHDKRNYTMNGLLVNQSILTREIQRFGSDERGYIYNCEYIFDMWASSYDY